MSEIDKNLYADAEEIAAAIGKSPRATRRMADKDNGNWAYEPEKIRGSEKKWFLIAKLPQDIRLAVICKRIEDRNLTGDDDDHSTGGHRPVLDTHSPVRLRDAAPDPVRGQLADTGVHPQPSAARCVDEGMGAAVSSIRDSKAKPVKKNNLGADKKPTALVDAGGDQCATGLGGLHLDGKRETLPETLEAADSEAPDSVVADIMESTTENAGGEMAGYDPGLPPLNRSQLRVHRAIKNIVDYVNGSGLSKKKAIMALNTACTAQGLNKTLRWSLEHAWEKRRAHCALSLDTYDKWLANFKKRGHYAPLKRQQDFSLKAWHVVAAELSRRPQGSSKKWIHAQLVEQFGKDAPGYDALYAWFKDKFSQMDQLKGRYTGSQLRSHRFYQHRTAEGLEPASLIHADGWNTHFTAPHPVTGNFVTFEVWHFHDVATRFVTTPGIGLTENATVISKGLENFVRELGVPARLQTDSTKVVKGSDRFTKAMHSLEERLGFTWTHPKEVGNSQANGIAENFNTSYLDQRARELSTYQNKNSMDDLSFKRVQKLTKQMVKAANNGDTALYEQKKHEIERVGKGHVFGSYAEAFAWIIQICNAFNDKPHSSLKKVVDKATGKKRCQTPREALNEHISNGWEPVALDEQELIEAFRPHVQVKVTRETVSPWGGMRYRNPEVLSHINDQQVIVAYDIADYQKVWVKDLKGMPICEASFVEATRYHAVTAQQADEEKRANQALKRLDQKRNVVIASIPVIDGNVIDGEVLERVPVIPSEPVEPLKRIVCDAAFNSEEEPPPMSYQDTVRMLKQANQ